MGGFIRVVKATRENAWYAKQIGERYPLLAIYEDRWKVGVRQPRIIEIAGKIFTDHYFILKDDGELEGDEKGIEKFFRPE